MHFSVVAWPTTSRVMTTKFNLLMELSFMLSRVRAQGGNGFWNYENKYNFYFK